MFFIYRIDKADLLIDSIYCMKHDPLSDTFCILKNTEDMGKDECKVPASSLIKSVLAVMKQKKYIKGFDFIEDGKAGKLNVKLGGKINNCGVIKPRFSVCQDEWFKWERRFLPSHDVGILIISTSKGVMDQETAKKQGIGGHLLGFVY